MAAIYTRWILAGRMTFADIPGRWQENVRLRLQEKGVECS